MSKNVECKFGVSCRRKDTDCRFYHPKECKFGVNCPLKDQSCNLSHPQECKFGSKCRRKDTDCHFSHREECSLGVDCPGKGVNCLLSHPQECRFGAKCRRKGIDCRYAHRKECANGANCHLRDCVWDHPKLPQPKAVCMFGNRCSNPKCTREHAALENLDSNKTVSAPVVNQMPCRFGLECKTKGCVFRHPGGFVAWPDVNISELCMAHLRGKCPSNDLCGETHLEEAERNRLLMAFGSRQCKYGAKCRTTGCLYDHLDSRNTQEERGWERAPQLRMPPMEFDDDFSDFMEEMEGWSL